MSRIQRDPGMEQPKVKRDATLGHENVEFAFGESRLKRYLFLMLVEKMEKLLLWISDLRSPVKINKLFDSPRREKTKTTPFFQSPEEVFPPPGWDIELKPVSEQVFRSVKVTKLHFPTPEPSGVPENDDAVAYLAERKGKKPASCAILVHPWRKARTGLSLELSICRDLSRRGLDMLLLVLPFHEDRSPDATLSGQIPLGGDPSRLLRYGMQIVSELQLLYFYLRKNYRNVGIIGASVGGLFAHLAMTVQPFDFGISILSGAPLADLLFNEILAEKYEKLLAESGYTLEELREAWWKIDPIRWGRFNRVRKILMIGGFYDKIIHPDLTATLWEAFGRPRLVWYPAAHWTMLLFYRSWRARMLALASEAESSLQPPDTGPSVR